jgi:hypothetical protein
MNNSEIAPSVKSPRFLQADYTKPKLYGLASIVFDVTSFLAGSYLPVASKVLLPAPWIRRRAVGGPHLVDKIRGLNAAAELGRLMVYGRLCIDRRPPVRNEYRMLILSPQKHYGLRCV